MKKKLKKRVVKTPTEKQYNHAKIILISMHLVGMGIETAKHSLVEYHKCKYDWKKLESELNLDELKRQYDNGKCLTDILDPFIKYHKKNNIRN